jgi:hypothetical protein
MPGTPGTLGDLGLTTDEEAPGLDSFCKSLCVNSG